MNNNFHIHVPNFNFDNSRNLKVLYFIVANRNLINKLVYFFFPIFLFNIGKNFLFFQHFNLSELQKGMLFIPIYYLLVRVFILFNSISLSKLISFLGYKNSLLMGQILYMFVAFSFWMMTKNAYFVFLAAFFNSFQIPLFWNSYHSFLSSHTMKSHMGEDLGLLQFLLHLVQVISPAIAGFIILQLGYRVLFILAIALNFIGIFITFLLKTKFSKTTPSWQEFFSWMKEKQYRVFSVSLMGRHLNDVMLSLWPLYVLFILGTVEKVGYLYTLSLFLSLILSFFIGIYIDHHKSRKPFVVSGTLLSMIWILRSQVSNVLGIAASDITDRLASNFHWLFFDALLYKRSKGKKSLSYFAYRETIISLSEIFIWIIFILVFLLSNSWTVLFSLAAVGVLMSLLMRDKIVRH